MLKLHQLVPYSHYLLKKEISSGSNFHAMLLHFLTLRKIFCRVFLVKINAMYEKWRVEVTDDRWPGGLYEGAKQQKKKN